MPYKKKMMQIFKSEEKTESKTVTHPCSKMGTLTPRTMCSTRSGYLCEWNSCVVIVGIFLWKCHIFIPISLSWKTALKLKKWSFSCREQTFILNILFSWNLHKFLISEDQPHVSVFSDKQKKNHIFTNIDIRNWSAGAKKT